MFRFPRGDGRQQRVRGAWLGDGEVDHREELGVGGEAEGGELGAPGEGFVVATLTGDFLEFFAMPLGNQDDRADGGDDRGADDQAEEEACPAPTMERFFDPDRFGRFVVPARREMA